ncbi:43850_t:CDS:1, partial [Gigaspora margarita]
MDTFGESHIQIEQDRGQLVNTIEIVQAQKTTPKQEAGTTELSNTTQIDKMKVEDTQVTIWNWNTEGSKQNTQPKSYSDIVRRSSITGRKGTQKRRQREKKLEWAK